ncbi:MAG TPA: hypothetical protein VHS58_21570, partial [Acetobacteraceae bacterium]|nr:hypothetical protein [Acetobacteraceae bacterium]
YGVLRRLRQSRPFRFLTPHLPQVVRKTGLLLATRPVRRHDAATADVVNSLRPVQRQQTEQLSRLLGRAFPEWRTLYGSDSG